MKRKSTVLLPLLALTLCLPLLPGCGRDKGSATPQAAQEFAELRAEQELAFAGDADNELQAEITALLLRFDKTADARLASTPHAITLLHLACVYKKTELARCLLQDGADPNARQLSAAATADMAAENEGAAPSYVPADTPLTWATIPHREGATAGEMLPLINLLVENGADVNQPGPLGLPPLVTATFVPSPAGEAVMLRLLELGARCPEFTPDLSGGHSVPLTALVAKRGWSAALARLLELQSSMATPTQSALHGAAAPMNEDTAGSLECARMLLAHGAEVDVLNEEGATPLYAAAHILGSPDGGEAAVQEAAAEMLALLLSHGANPLLCCDADPEFPGSCAADFIAMSPRVQELLAQKGIQVPRRPINFAARGSTLLAEICRASLFQATPEEIAPHVGMLRSLLLTPEHELEHSHLYPDALGHAVKLLCRADAAQAGEFVAQLPLWREEKAWKEADARTASLMHALLSTPELILPRAALLEHARRLDAWGMTEAAALLAELLERDAKAGAEIDTLCEDTSPAIRAGALTARLLRADLPAPRNGAVRSWMEFHGIEEENAPTSLRQALLLTSLDKFWYGDMEPAEVRALLDAMQTIGAPAAAAFYAELAQNLSNPEELDRLMAVGGAAELARFELEAATALFLWNHREELLPLRRSEATESANESGN